MKLSMMQKFMALLFPLTLMGIVCVTLTWISLSGDGHTLARANRANELALNSRISISDMGSALKGYLLDPQNTKESVAKKEADEANEKALTELVSISTNPKILDLAKEMDEFDEKDLNVSEDKVMALVSAGKIAEAQKTFGSEYLPLRAKYDEMSKRLSALVAEQSAQEITNVKTSQTRAAWTITISLLAGLILIAFMLIMTSWRLRSSLVTVVSSVNGSADKLGHQATAITSTSEKMSEASGLQSSALQQTAASIEEINAMVKRTSENAQQSQKVATRCTEKADQGKTVIGEMLGSIRLIGESTEMIRTKVESGNREIGEIVRLMNEVENKTRVINDIVFQTKLLSFNASVEAARAGENGKGFSVVAEEIGNLAQMSGHAAKEISEILASSSEKVSQIIANNQSEIEKEIARGQECADNGGKVARSCAEVFEELIENVNSMTQALGEITVASEEQARGVNEITKAINELDRAGRETSAATTEVVDSSREVNAQSDELLGIVRTLTGVINGSTKSTASIHAINAQHQDRNIRAA